MLRVELLLWMLILVSIFCVNKSSGKAFRPKRSASSDDNMDLADSSLDRIHINYDEYPVRCDLFFFYF